MHPYGLPHRLLSMCASFAAGRALAAPALALALAPLRYCVDKRPKTLLAGSTQVSHNKAPSPARFIMPPPPPTFNPSAILMRMRSGKP
jgi:hypothetical protein